MGHLYHGHITRRPLLLPSSFFSGILLPHQTCVHIADCTLALILIRRFQIQIISVLLRLIGRRGRTVPDFYSVKTIWNTLSWPYYLVWFYLVLFLFDAFVTAMPPGMLNFRETLGIVVRVLPSILFIFLFSIFARNQGLPEDKAVLKADVDKDE